MPNHHAILFEYLIILFVNYTSVKLKKRNQNRVKGRVMRVGMEVWKLKHVVSENIEMFSINESRMDYAGMEGY